MCKVKTSLSFAPIMMNLAFFLHNLQSPNSINQTFNYISQLRNPKLRMTIKFASVYKK